MENEEKRIKEEVVDNYVFNDESMFRCLHTFKDGIVSADELDVWINSPITKALIKGLDYYCMYTFEELMNQSLGGIGKHKDTPKMHLWLPKNATEDQVKLVKKMIKG